MYFYYFVITWSSFEQNWIPFTQKCNVPTLVESGRMVRKFFFKFRQCISAFSLLSPLRKRVCSFFLTNFTDLYTCIFAITLLSLLGKDLRYLLFCEGGNLRVHALTLTWIKILNIINLKYNQLNIFMLIKISCEKFHLNFTQKFHANCT